MNIVRTMYAYMYQKFVESLLPSPYAPPLSHSAFAALRYDHYRRKLCCCCLSPPPPTLSLDQAAAEHSRIEKRREGRGHIE